jgi:hypothetical protein
MELFYRFINLYGMETEEFKYLYVMGLAGILTWRYRLHMVNMGFVISPYCGTGSHTLPHNNAVLIKYRLKVMVAQKVGPLVH